MPCAASQSHILRSEVQDNRLPGLIGFVGKVLERSAHVYRATRAFGERSVGGSVRDNVVVGICLSDQGAIWIEHDPDLHGHVLYAFHSNRGAPAATDFLRQGVLLSLRYGWPIVVVGGQFALLLRRRLRPLHSGLLLLLLQLVLDVV